MTLEKLIRDAKENLRDWALDNPQMVKSGNDDGQIHQIADSLTPVPVYTHDLPSLFIVYEKLVEALHKEWSKLGDVHREYDNYRDECEDEDEDPLSFREWYEKSGAILRLSCRR